MHKNLRSVTAVIAGTATLLFIGQAALAQPAAKVLNNLPAQARQGLAPLFTANAIGQAGLNGQRKGSPQALFDLLKASLSKAGYAEQPIRTTIGTWGFSATWAPPTGTSVDGTPNGQQAVLVTQATALAPDKLNLNLRFEGVAPLATQGQGQQAPSNNATPARPSLSVPRGLF